MKRWNFRISLSAARAAALALALGLVCGQQAPAAIINLASANSTATFHTEAADGAELGLNTWNVDGTDQMFQQWFWYRTGAHTQENRVDGTGELAHVNAIASDLDGDTQNDFLLVNYADTTGPEQFTVQFRYILTGGSTGSRNSDLVEVIRIRNTSTTPLSLNFFQYVDFDLNGSSGDDSLIITGTPQNTATQSDPSLIIGETVVTPSPWSYEANIFSATRTKLDDAALDNLNNSSGPIVNADATWAFQWNWSGLTAIPPGGTVLISKDKNIRPNPIPEPSTVALAGLALAGFLLRRRLGSR